MSSIIPKIKVGLASSKRNKLNLSFDCSTTSNIGNIQPTMCREMVPNSKMKVKVSSLVRLASMPLPTFGRMSLRHYHAFIPYQDVYEPFNALMSGQHYYAGGVNWIPTAVPTYTTADLLYLFQNYSDITICPSSNLNKPLQITVDNISTYDGTIFEYGQGKTYTTYEAAVKAAQDYDLGFVKTAWDRIRLGYAGTNAIQYCAFAQSRITPFFGKRGDASGWKTDKYGSINLGSMSARIDGEVDSSGLTIGYNSPGTIYYTGGTPITPDGADLITQVGDYTVLYKFLPSLKRLRTIFIGLGYSFTPYGEDSFSVLKLLAYYKGWFNIFSPNREKAFVDTNCYKYIKYVSTVANPSTVTIRNMFTDFVDDLMNDCYYYLPMDYFSMSVLKPQYPNQDNTFRMYSLASGNASDAKLTTNDSVYVNAVGSAGTDSPIVRTDSTNGAMSPLTMKLAFQMLKWANKNTVIGRSIRDYLKVHFGVTDIDDHESDSVYVIGSSRTNVTISDVMSTAESDQGYLGEYGGKGIGYGDSETFDYTAKNFGVWITYTVVVPESGYYQGYLKENRHFFRYDFFNPEFDALGYQVLERGEVMDDYNSDGPNWNPTTDYKRTQAFGFVPRYSEYKVGRNIVNGDLSLVGLKNSMAPYTLDRRFAGGQYGYNGITVPGGPIMTIVKPDFVPSVVYDGFRRIDPTDHLGQYNRIFNYGGNDLDHFIIHNVFEVVAFAPMKPLTSSFDTVDEGERTVDMTHS